MKLKYHSARLNYYERMPPKSFTEKLKLLDKDLDVVFNRSSGRWELYRWSSKGWQWILEVSEEDGSYRPLDNRVIHRLWEIDIIERYGSISNFERASADRQKKWQDEQQKQMDYELKCDIKDDRKLWQQAAENLRSGIVNSPPKEKEGKIFSYSKGV